MKQSLAKYEEIAMWVISRIKSKELCEGSRLESENQLCTKFHVSRQTVRRAFALLEKKNLIEKRRGSGTYIKEIPIKREKSTRQIAVLVTYAHAYIFSQIIQSIEEKLAQEGYSMQIAITGNEVEKERAFLKQILEWDSVDGLIAETTRSGLPNPNISLYKEITDRQIPVLFINSSYPELTIPCISLNDRAAGKLITNYLLEEGHRKIAAVFKSDDGQGHERYAGYLEAMLEAAIEVKNQQVIWIDTDQMENLSANASWIFQRIKGCTACICYNDEVAVEICRLCKKEGIQVPEDLSVTGIDDSDIARYCEIPLTSVKNPLDELGKSAASGILKMIQGRKVPQKVKLKPQIVVRDSVKRL